MQDRDLLYFGPEQRRRPDLAQGLAQLGQRGAAPQTARLGQEGQTLLRSP